MPAKRAARGASKKKAPSRTRKAAPRENARKTTAQPHDHDDAHDEHEHVEFTLSKKTASAIDRALKALAEPQQRRVLDAVDRVGEEAGETVGRWVEENVVANANELLALMVPDMASSGRWGEIRAIFQFLDHLDLPIDHARMVQEVKKAHGAKVVAEYQKEVGAKKKR